MAFAGGLARLTKIKKVTIVTPNAIFEFYAYCHSALLNTQRPWPRHPVPPQCQSANLVRTLAYVVRVGQGRIKEVAEGNG
jgi:hypothetical protein